MHCREPWSWIEFSLRLKFHFSWNKVIRSLFSYTCIHMAMFLLKPYFLYCQSVKATVKAALFGTESQQRRPLKIQY
jgi:hypothetical protein